MPVQDISIPGVVIKKVSGTPYLNELIIETENSLELRDTGNLQIQYSYPWEPGNVWDISFDGTFIAVGDKAGAVILYSTEDGSEIKRFSDHSAAIKDVDIGYNGNYVSSIGDDNKFIVRDLELGKNAFHYTHDEGFLLAELSRNSEWGTFIIKGSNSVSV